MLSEDQQEWNNQGVQQNPVELGTLSVREIFSKQRTENLGARVQPPIVEESLTTGPKVTFEVTTVVFPTPEGEVTTVTYPTLVGASSVSHNILPPKRRGRPRKENFITPQKNDLDTGVSRSEQMALGMRQSKRKEKLGAIRQQRRG